MFLTAHVSQAKSAPRLVVAPTVTASVYSPEHVLAEAMMEAQAGSGSLDDHLVHRLESLTKDLSLPHHYRARALSLLCRFG